MRCGRPQKKKIISRIKAYHGVTIAAASLTGLPGNHRDFDLPLPGFLHTGVPASLSLRAGGESEEDFATRLAVELDALIVNEGPDTVAAFIAEPVMGAGGVIVPPETYFEKIMPVCAKHDLFVISDEVICGFGRLGHRLRLREARLQAACDLDRQGAVVGLSADRRGDDPGSHVPGAALAESRKIGVFGHGFTYGGHPVSAAVALKTLEIYARERIVDQAAQTRPAVPVAARRRSASIRWSARRAAWA